MNSNVGKYKSMHKLKWGFMNALTRVLPHKTKIYMKLTLVSSLSNQKWEYMLKHRPFLLKYVLYVDYISIV